MSTPDSGSPDPVGGVGDVTTDAAARPDTSRRPAHAVRPFPRPNRVAAGIGVAAAVAGIGLGTAALIRLPAPPPEAARTLQPITVTSPPSAALPAASDILALLDRSPDFGPLADAQRRASCLTGLGYPASTRVLGAQRIEMNGHPAVLLVLPADRSDTVAALAVLPNCSSADTGLLGDTVVSRP